MARTDCGKKACAGAEGNGSIIIQEDDLRAFLPGAGIREIGARQITSSLAAYSQGSLGNSECRIERLRYLFPLISVIIPKRVGNHSKFLDLKGYKMKMNDRLNGFLWGTAVGAGAAAIVGLSMGWIVSSSKANVIANERAQAVLVAAMAPICVDRFQNTEGYATRLAALKEIKASWERRAYVAKGTWANVGKELNYGVADACAEALNSL